MNTDKLDDLEKTIKNLIKEVQNLRVNCSNCGYFNHRELMCSNFKARPPIEVMVIGCPQHDLIPF